MPHFPDRSLVLWFRPELERGKRGRWMTIATDFDDLALEKHRAEYRRPGDFVILPNGETPWRSAA